MASDERKPARRPREPEWPPLLYRKIGFFFGLALAGWETVIDKGAHLVIYGIAFIFTGLPIAKGMEKLIDLLAGWLGRGR